MIKIENVDVYGWEAAIRGMRNPLDSWNKSDSCYLTINEIAGHPCDDGLQKEFVIGENDLQLMKKLVKAGTDHRKFMRMITVTMDIVAPMYWWKEFDTYKVGTVRNSCSTMHTIHKKEFTLADFSCEHLDDEWFDVDSLGYTDDSEIRSITLLELIVEVLNVYRKKYLKTKNKNDWWQMIQLLPSSYNQRSTVQLNYAVLRNIYHSRKNHKIDEWRDFCKWVEGLPYSELITMEGSE